MTSANKRNKGYSIIVYPCFIAFWTLFFPLRFDDKLSHCIKFHFTCFMVIILVDLTGLGRKVVSSNVIKIMFKRKSTDWWYHKQSWLYSIKCKLMHIYLYSNNKRQKLPIKSVTKKGKIAYSMQSINAFRKLKVLR